MSEGLYRLHSKLLQYCQEFTNLSSSSITFLWTEIKQTEKVHTEASQNPSEFLRTEALCVILQLQPQEVLNVGKI